MTDHIPWAGLPGPVRAAVTARTGPVLAARDIPYGYNCRHTSVLDTPGGPVFIKAARSPEATALHDREQRAAPFTGGVAPVLRWRTRTHGWDILAFHALPGARHIQLRPGSPDLVLLADLLRTGTTLTAPPGLPAYADQFADHATAGELPHLHGDTLVHGDTNPHNALISGGRAWLVDWAAATRGPAWTDVAEAAVRLMEDGHTAQDADAWARTVPAWRHAAPDAVTAWAAIRCRAWTARIGPSAAAPSNARFRSLAACRAEIPPGGETAPGTA